MVLVDTPIWSLAFRRFGSNPSPLASRLATLIRRNEAVLFGPIRQEILSGIRETKQFEALREGLSAFADLPLESSDFETAASFFNLCRAKGIQGSNTDFLMCAVAKRIGIPIFTTDKDFINYRKVLELELLADH